MNHYINIKVLPDPEFEAYVLMNALFAKCHRALGQLGKGAIGVSFPEYKDNLGAVLRLHGSQNYLTQLMDENWLKGLNDYTHISDIQPIPEAVQYRTVERIQTKSPHKKRKRSISKGWLSPEEAAEKIVDNDQHIIRDLPFAQLTSLSNNNPYRVFIRHGELVPEPSAGEFNSYGLSKTATIPWF